jgi:hypothetical protein
MSITNPSRGLGHRSRGETAGPRIAFLATMASAAALILINPLPSHLLMPVITTLLFVLALVFALVAWVRCSTDEYGVTYWDVAGAVVLIGIGASVLIDPEQLAGFVAGHNSEH